MRIGLILSIREKSIRLPGKVLKKIKGQTVTEHLIDRLKLATNVDEIIIGTSDNPRDLVFGKFAKNKGVKVFYGDQDDKLKRYLQICENYNLDAVIIVDGDDILCFPEIMKDNSKLLRDRNYDVIFWKDLPLGAASSGLTKNALERVMMMKAESDTEVWGGYFTNSNEFNVLINKSGIEIFNHPEIRMTMDYEEDFEFLKLVFNELYSNNTVFSSLELMDLLVNKKPSIQKITKEAQVKYEENIKKAKPVKFK